jgi:hypothetical protein
VGAGRSGHGAGRESRKRVGEVRFSERDDADALALEPGHQIRELNLVLGTAEGQVRVLGRVRGFETVELDRSVDRLDGDLGRRKVRPDDDVQILCLFFGTLTHSRSFRLRGTEKCPPDAA